MLLRMATLGNVISSLKIVQYCGGGEGGIFSTLKGVQHCRGILLSAVEDIQYRGGSLQAR